MSTGWETSLGGLLKQAPSTEEHLVAWVGQVEELLMDAEQFGGVGVVQGAVLGCLAPTWRAERPEDGALDAYLTLLDRCSQPEEPSKEVWAGLQRAGKAVVAAMDDSGSSEHVAQIAETVAGVLEGGPPDLDVLVEDVLHTFSVEPQALADAVRARLQAWLDAQA